MSFAHMTLASRHVERTAAFLEQTLGYPRIRFRPTSSTMPSG